MRTWGNSWKKHEEPEDKNPHFLYTRLVLDLARPKLVNCWSPLNHASHCMTTSWSAVATQTRAWVNPAMQSKVFLCQMPFLPQPSLFSAWTPAQNNAGVHGLRLGIGPPRHSLKSQVILHLSLLYSDVCFIGLFYMAVWLSSSALVSINTVVLHQARLVLGWVTVWRQIQSRPRRYLTLSNPVPWQNWMAAYLDYTLQMKTLFHGWPAMAHETHTRRRSA